MTLRVRERVDMIETPLQSITIRGTRISIMTPTHSTKMIIGWTTMSWTTIIRIQFPLSRDILLTQDLIVGITIPSSISLPVSNLYSFCNTTFFVINSLVMCLQALPNVHYRVGQSISLRNTEGQISVLIHVIQQVLSEIPVRHLYDHSVMKRWLMSPKYSSGTRE